MRPASVDQQIHGYRNGHQLIAASRRLPRPDQDLVDRLSDMAGQLRPSETFKPYLTVYPVPSGNDYVVARTWQDLEAPRSGCVRTRSLIVPLDLWLSLDGIGGLLPLMTPVRFDERPAPLDPVNSAPVPRRVTDPRRIELVEALFLEPRQPIVIFDFPEAEAAAERILAALWPAMKQNFSVSTFTLAPRRVEGRSFDLTFAPKGARGRFSDWIGRRVDGALKMQRHPWSAQIAEQIFDGDHPDLRSIDTLGALRADRKGDEGALRLSMLWNDLAAKATTTPSAVLGMLDILNSRSTPEFDRARLQGTVLGAARLASDDPDEIDALKFLSTLATKVANLDPAMVPQIGLPELARQVTRRSPERALEYLASELAADREPGVPIVTGLADALGEADLHGTASDLALRLPPDLTATMILHSALYAREAFARSARDPTAWGMATAAALRSMSRQDRAILLQTATPYLIAASQAPVLEAALDGISGSDLAEFAVAIGEQTKFELAAFDEPIANAARDAESLTALRAAIISNFDDDGSDRFLLSTLDLSPADVAWLDEEVARVRAARLLRHLIDRAPHRSLVSVQRDLASRDRILGLLMGDVAGSAEQLFRIASSGDLPIDRLLDVGGAALPYLPEDRRGKLAVELLGRVFAEAEFGDARIPSILYSAWYLLSPRQLVHMATPPAAPSWRVAANLMLLSHGPDDLRRAAATAIEDLCDRLIHRYGENLGQHGYGAWALLLSEAGSVSPAAQLRASLFALPFAMSKRDLPVSALIGAAFPPVYFELLRSKGEEDFRRLPALLMLPISFFYDWDRAKSARHELVDAFMFSSWPPADLMVTSIMAGIEREALHRLEGTHRGREYLGAIDRDSRRLAPEKFTKIQELLSRSRHIY
jgi:hypothetical protein